MAPGETGACADALEASTSASAVAIVDRRFMGRMRNSFRASRQMLADPGSAKTR
jgi:hypothetical protein